MRSARLLALVLCFTGSGSALAGRTIDRVVAVVNDEIILDSELEEFAAPQLRKGGCVGLANCRDRLEVLYGERQSFQLSDTDPHGLTITICIPLERGETSR